MYFYSKNEELCLIKSTPAETHADQGSFEPFFFCLFVEFESLTDYLLYNQPHPSDRVESNDGTELLLQMDYFLYFLYSQ